MQVLQKLVEKASQVGGRDARAGKWVGEWVVGLVICLAAFFQGVPGLQHAISVCLHACLWASGLACLHVFLHPAAGEHFDWALPKSITCPLHRPRPLPPRTRRALNPGLA